MAERARTILHVCPDRELAGSRRRVVRAIGYDVVWVENEGAALFEISMGRCGILLLCHLLPETVRGSLTEYFRTQCPDPYIVAVVAHETEPHPLGAHARVLYSADHAGLAALLRQRLAA
jgi:DNA-binding response OmpR family regulator